MKKFQNITKLFWIFLKVGSFTFGGGYAMLPLIRNEVVTRQKWIGEAEIVDVFAISQSVPGVISINSALFIGNKVAGVPGAVAAALGMILPAFVSIILILVLLLSLKRNIYVDKVFGGIRAASAALIFLAALELGRGILTTKLGWLIAAGSFVAIALFNVNAAWSVIGGGAAGYFAYLALQRRK